MIKSLTPHLSHVILSFFLWIFPFNLRSYHQTFLFKKSPHRSCLILQTALFFLSFLVKFHWLILIIKIYKSMFSVYYIKRQKKSKKNTKITHKFFLHLHFYKVFWNNRHLLSYLCFQNNISVIIWWISIRSSVYIESRWNIFLVF